MIKFCEYSNALKLIQFKGDSMELFGPLYTFMIDGKEYIDNSIYLFSEKTKYKPHTIVKQIYEERLRLRNCFRTRHYFTSLEALELFISKKEKGTFNKEEQNKKIKKVLAPNRDRLWTV